MTKDNNFFFTHPDPIVQALLNTELIPEKMIPVLSDPTISNNPKVQAIILLLLGETGLNPINKVSEAASILKVTPYTITRYMNELVKEGLIEKITPTASPNSHYYAKKKI